MCESFLSYLFCENFVASVSEILSYVNWSEDDKLKYNYPNSISINFEDLKRLEKATSANEILSKLYFEDNEILFLIVYTQRIINLSRLPEFFTYNSDLENPEFQYNPDIHEHIYLSNVEVFMIRTKSKIFIFGNSNFPDEHFKPFVLTNETTIIKGLDAKKLFDRLGIKNKRNFETLINKIESFYKKKIK